MNAAQRRAFFAKYGNNLPKRTNFQPTSDEVRIKHGKLVTMNGKSYIVSAKPEQTQSESTRILKKLVPDEIEAHAGIPSFVGVSAKWHPKK